MIYRELGRTGMNISIIGFGGMRFFNKNEATATATVQRCLERGINFFETGGYGNGKSEEWLGRALWQSCRREDVVLADKVVACDMPSADQVRAGLEAALKRYQTDYFDVFSFWGTNTREMHEHVLKGGPLDAALKAKEEGLVRALGITTHAQPDWIREFVDAYPWDMVVLKEHILYTRQQETIAYLGEKGVGVVVMTPLAGGVVCAPGAELKAEFDRAGTSAAQLGLRYLVSNPHITSAISGMTTPEEVDENAVAGETGGPLSAAEEALVALVHQKTSALDEKFCTSCGYCQPCPEEVNIPGIFRLWNLMRGYGNASYSKLEYQKLHEQRHWADFPGSSAEHCVECGECETKCPEGLSIIDDLKTAHTALTKE
ncbi:aldo/keto reductase [Verrucomicrobiota bacterium]